MFETKLVRTTLFIEFLESEINGYLYCHMIQDYPKPLSAYQSLIATRTWLTREENLWKGEIFVNNQCLELNGWWVILPEGF